MLRRRGALTLTLLVLGCRPVPSEIHEPEPEGMEPVETDSLVRDEGRLGPDPEAPERAEVPAALGPRERFSGDPIARTIEPDGLMIADHALGAGPEAKPGDTVHIHYVGALQDGREFDSSHSRGPFVFELGGGMVIDGLDRGLVGARVGMLRALTIPAALGYGDRGAGTTIPGGATLVFYVEVLEVEPPATVPGSSPG